MPWKPLPEPGGTPPAPVGTALDRLLRNLGAPRTATVRSVFDRWPELVGDGLAGQATPVSLKDGRLLLSVPDPAWATQLMFLERDLLAKLAEAFGPDEVRSIDVAVRAPNRRRR